MLSELLFLIRGCAGTENENRIRTEAGGRGGGVLVLEYQQRRSETKPITVIPRLSALSTKGPPGINVWPVWDTV